MSKELMERLRDSEARDCCSQRAEAANRIEELEAELRTRDNAEATHRITLREVQAETMRLQTKLDALKLGIEELERERDAAFAMSKCECESDEACRNLVKLHNERDSLQADNARLREAFQWIAAQKASGAIQVKAIEALAVTPEQSLARIRNQVREECALEADRQLEDEPYGHAKFRCANIALEIRATKEPE